MDTLLGIVVVTLVLWLLMVLPISFCLRIAERHGIPPLAAIFVGLLLSWLGPPALLAFTSEPHGSDDPRSRAELPRPPDRLHEHRPESAELSAPLSRR